MDSACGTTRRPTWLSSTPSSSAARASTSRERRVVMVTGTESWASSEATRRSMQSNRGRDTSPELVVRRVLHAEGLRYRVNYRPVPGLRRTADIVFTRAKVAVFIDGCFWHGCPEHYQRPASNKAFWDTKRAANRTRDDATDAALGRAGWMVLRFWEHDIAHDLVRVAREIAEHSGQPGSPLLHDGSRKSLRAHHD